MRKKILYFTTIIAMVLFAACSNEDALPENTGRTLSLTASMPGEGATQGEPSASASVKGEPITRVSLDQGTTATVVKWVVDDEIQLAFVPATGATGTKQIVTATVNKVTEEGKKAHFTINVPNDITGAFTLYGVYGDGGIDISGANPVAKLPTDLGTTKSLAEIQSKKHVMLYFPGVAMNTTSLGVQEVSFKHIGAIFCIKVKNIGTNDLTVTGAQLTSATTSLVIGVATTSFDLVNKSFIGSTPLINKISFAAPANSILKKRANNIDGKMEFWGWYPPSTKDWGNFNIKLLGTTNRVTNAKNGKVAVAGQTYYFYGVYENGDFNFTTKANF